MVNKFLQRVLGRRAGKVPSFALTIGDSDVDDYMFEVLHRPLLFP